MRGILFKPDMIKAIVEGRKTVTRRVMKPQPIYQRGVLRWINKEGIVDINMDDHTDLAIPYARYQVGETVYIKEAWCENYTGDVIHYKFDGGKSPGPKDFWRPPMFMPAWAARYFITITGVRAERLREIDIEDCKNEGINDHVTKIGNEWLSDAKVQFSDLWDSINKPPYDWASNCWVWVYSFRLREDK